MNLMAFELLRSMTSLIHLDLSTDRCNTPQFRFLIDADWLPNLVSLDLSGYFNYNVLNIVSLSYMYHSLSKRYL